MLGTMADTNDANPGMAINYRSQVEQGPEVSQMALSSNSLVSTKLRPSQARPKLVV
jgi:hypothetical protein